MNNFTEYGMDQLLPNLKLVVRNLNTGHTSVLAEHQFPAEIHRRCYRLVQRGVCEFNSPFGRSRLEIIPTFGGALFRIRKTRAILAVAAVAVFRIHDEIIWRKLLDSRRTVLRLSDYDAMNVIPSTPQRLPWLGTFLSPVATVQMAKWCGEIETLVWAIGISVLHQDTRAVYRN